MNVALPDARLKLKLLTNLSDEEKRSHSTILAASRAGASIYFFSKLNVVCLSCLYRPK